MAVKCLLHLRIAIGSEGVTDQHKDRILNLKSFDKILESAGVGLSARRPQSTSDPYSRRFRLLQ